MDVFENLSQREQELIGQLKAEVQGIVQVNIAGSLLSSSCYSSCEGICVTLAHDSSLCLQRLLPTYGLRIASHMTSMVAVWRVYRESEQCAMVEEAHIYHSDAVYRVSCVGPWVGLDS